MTVNPPVLKSVMEKGQGTAARMLDRLPGIAKEALVKALDYPHVYPDLDHSDKYQMANKIILGHRSCISEYLVHSRTLFDARMKAIRARQTAVNFGEQIRLPLQSGGIFARPYHPAPQKK